MLIGDDSKDMKKVVAALSRMIHRRWLNHTSEAEGGGVNVDYAEERMKRLALEAAHLERMRQDFERLVTGVTT